MACSLSQVLNGLQQKRVILPQTVIDLENCLKERDVPRAQEPLSPVLVKGRPSDVSIAKQNGNVRLDKRQIEQRIEEDRERHKRLRESIWAISADGDEFDRLWKDGSDIGEDDYLAAEEDAAQRMHEVEFG